MQLAAAVVGEDLGPVGRVVEAAEVGLELAGQHLERRALADAVGADQAEHLFLSFLFFVVVVVVFCFFVFVFVLFFVFVFVFCFF